MHRDLDRETRNKPALQLRPYTLPCTQSLLLNLNAANKHCHHPSGPHGRDVRNRPQPRALSRGRGGGSFARASHARAHTLAIRLALAVPSPSTTLCTDMWLQVEIDECLAWIPSWGCYLDVSKRIEVWASENVLLDVARRFRMRRRYAKAVLYRMRALHARWKKRRMRRVIQKRLRL